jgi:hypothetical protein
MDRPRVQATKEQAQKNTEHQAEADFDIHFACLLTVYAEESEPDKDLITPLEALRPQLRAIHRSLRVRHWQDTLTEYVDACTLSAKGR